MNGSQLSFAPQPGLPPPPPPNQQPHTVSKPKKMRRISQACDFCHKRSIRCKPSTDEPQRCQNCLDFGVACTYLRPKKKRGIKSGSTRKNSEAGSGSASGSAPGSRAGERDAQMLLELTNGTPGSSNFHAGGQFFIPEKWQTLVQANEKNIKELVHVYFEIVYPIFPLFHQPSMLARTENRDYVTDHSFFADIMSICALASARVRDGALFPGRRDVTRLQEPAPEVFFAAAKEAIPEDLSKMRGLDWMRTCAMLAIYGIQVGKIDIMHQYLGMYHTLVSMDSLHDEKNWPKNIGIVEIELRRRLFWSMYTLEVYSSIVWGSIIRCREAPSQVSYPSEVNDEFFSDTGYQGVHHLIQGYNPQPIKDSSCWLHGWNFATELYRILEHAMDDFHRRRPTSVGPLSPRDLFGRNSPDQNVVLNKIMSMHSELPHKFKDAKLVRIGTASKNEIFSFQAANISATLQLVRMILFTSVDATVDQKCHVARELLSGLAQIPVEFLRAISSPLLHHLAGIGSILGSVMEGLLSEAAYYEVRQVLSGMASLLSSLESGITRNVGAASRLQTQITAIDDYMAMQRQNEYSSLSNNALPPSIPTSAGPDGNSNIDPSLQDPHANNTYPPSTNPYNYSAAGAVNSMGMGTTADGQFQLPPELLENWPWPADITQGLSGGI